MTEKVKHFLESLSQERRWELEIANRCGPVLKAVKAANLLAVPSGGWQQVCGILKDTPIICHLLYADGQREILYLYRYHNLQCHLKQRQVQEFLSAWGYEAAEPKPVLHRLSYRYQRYAGAGEPFPHELGVLLQYPVEDVEGFIAHKGQDWLASGYWKVYGNVREAEETFADYDQARFQAVTEVLSGWPFSQVASAGLADSSQII